jgi:hypothetical protein
MLIIAALPSTGGKSMDTCQEWVVLGSRRCGRAVTILELGWGPVALCSECATKAWVNRNNLATGRRRPSVDDPQCASMLEAAAKESR